MSANIQWQPVNLKWRDMDGSSRHVAALRRLFGHEDEGCEFVIGEALLERLRGLDVGETSSSFWSELIKAVEDHGAIRVQVVY